MDQVIAVIFRKDYLEHAVVGKGLVRSNSRARGWREKSCLGIFFNMGKGSRLNAGIRLDDQEI